MATVKVGDNWQIEVGDYISVIKIETPRIEKDGVVNLDQYKSNKTTESKFKKYTVVLGSDNIIRVVSVAKSTPIKLPNNVKEALLEIVKQEHGKGLYRFLK